MPNEEKKTVKRIKKVPFVYTIKYRRKVFLGDSVEEKLVVKEEDMLSLVTILSTNGYLITSVKLLPSLSGDSVLKYCVEGVDSAEVK